MKIIINQQYNNIAHNATSIRSSSNNSSGAVSTFNDDLINELKYLKPQDNKGLDTDATEEADWTAREYVWVPDDHECFVRASLKEENGEHFCELDGGTQIEVHRDNIQLMNQPKFNKVDDMTELTCFNEPSVLYNLKERYYSGLVHTLTQVYFVWLLIHTGV